MIRFISKYIIIIWALALAACALSGCIVNRETAIRRINRYETNYPDLIKVKIHRDTIYSRDTFALKIPVKIDSSAIDSLMNIYCRDLQILADTVHIHHSDTVRIQALKTIQQYVYRECTPDRIIRPTSYTLFFFGDTIVVGVKGTPTGLELNILDHKKTIEETKTESTPPSTPSTWQEIKAGWSMWLTFLVAGLVAGFVLGKKK